MPRAWYNGVAVGGGGGGLTEEEVLALIASERANTTARGPGLSLSLTSTTVTGGGAETYLALTTALALTIGRAYELSGTLTATDAGGGVLFVRRMEGTILRRITGPSWEIVDDGEARDSQVAAGIAGYYATWDDRPALGWRDDTGALSLAHTLRSGAPSTATLAFAGLIAERRTL